MEIDLYFKNVGQGDTIFIHWANDKRFALIDCNLVAGGIAPVIRHIKKFSIKCFDFVVMSHPHSDHFSGFPKLFEYCKDNKIEIKRFLHTSTFDPIRLAGMFNRELNKDEHFEVATSTVNRGKHKELLWHLFAVLAEQHALKPNGFIKAVHTINNDYPIYLENGVQLKFLAPYDYDEFGEYMRRTFNADAQERLEIKTKYENNPYANFLSSFIRIFHENGDWHVLLCSDTTKYTLRRIYQNQADYGELNTRELIALQIPHHGSHMNHHPDFWKDMLGFANAKVVVSVGSGYGHPDKEVIEFFGDPGSRLHVTNYVGGYKEWCESQPANSELTLLDAIMGMPGVMPDAPMEEETNQGDNKCGEKHIKIIVNEGRAECRVID